MIRNATRKLQSLSKETLFQWIGHQCIYMQPSNSGWTKNNNWCSCYYCLAEGALHVLGGVLISIIQVYLLKWYNSVWEIFPTSLFVLNLRYILQCSWNLKYPDISLECLLQFNIQNYCLHVYQCQGFPETQADMFRNIFYVFKTGPTIKNISGFYLIADGFVHSLDANFPGILDHGITTFVHYSTSDICWHLLTVREYFHINLLH